MAGKKRIDSNVAQQWHIDIINHNVALEKQHCHPYIPACGPARMYAV